MAKKNLYLIRHGKAAMDGSDRERVLDSDGIIQATSLCKKIKTQFKDQKIRIISSPFKRAMQTIEKLSQDMAADIEKSQSDNSLARKLFNWKPEKRLEDWLKETIK